MNEYIKILNYIFWLKVSKPLIIISVNSEAPINLLS